MYLYNFFIRITLNKMTINEDYLIIYIYDSELLCYGDLSLRHHQFVYSSILDVNKKLKK